ncbi:MAG: ABC transporter ATP-binding protein [Actinomycetia bacterium]|nr:ABC transporter ATP-binding protein [Actinomycetes bacterium]
MNTVSIPTPSPTPPIPVIECRGLVKRYGTTTALGGIDLVIGSGITGLLGSNGAGKTTLLGLVLGLHRADEGELRVFGFDPNRFGSDVRAGLGYSPEHHVLPPDMRAIDLVRHVAELHGLPRRDARSRASDVLWQVGLGEERSRALGTMSTGQRQRVKLAQAIVHDPHLVLLDEPTDGLDPVQRDDMLALIRRIGSEFGIDIVLSSHLLEEVERICDQAVILGDGRVQASGRLDEMLAGGAGIVVELGTADEAETVAAALTGAGWPVERATRKLTVSPVDPDGPIAPLEAAVLTAVAQAGASVHRLHPRRATLEELYLDTVS